MKLDWNGLVKKIKKENPGIRMSSRRSEVPKSHPKMKNETSGVYPKEYTDAFGEDHSFVAGLPEGY